MSSRRPQLHKRGKNPKHAPVESQVMVLHDCFNTANMLRTLMLGTRPDMPPPGTPPPHQGDRTYWDAGRTAPVGELKTLLALNQAFGAVFLDMLEELKKRRGEGPPP